MRCPRCSNEDPRYFYKGRQGYYCRKCVRFKRILLEDVLAPKEYEIEKEAGEARLSYKLTPQQEVIAQACLAYVRDFDVLLWCVTGAGKTELTIKSISAFLKEGCKVAYAISRREVVLELSGRFKKIFPFAKVVTLCEGFSYPDTGDLIVCTTHQLYRFPKTFDLLILDEVDAFPFKGDEVLNNIALNSVKGHIIYSTATIDPKTSELIKRRPTKILRLTKRPHGYPLIVPKIIYGPKIVNLVKLYFYLKRSDQQVIVFAKSKEETFKIYSYFKYFLSITYVYSDLKERSEHIKAFKDKRYQFLVATTVMERGITIKGVNVVIVDHLKGVFDKASIIQMAGRVGRSFEMPSGEVLVLANHYDKELKSAIKEIKDANLSVL